MASNFYIENIKKVESYFHSSPVPDLPGMISPYRIVRSLKEFVDFSILELYNPGMDVQEREERMTQLRYIANEARRAAKT